MQFWVLSPLWFIAFATLSCGKKSSGKSDGGNGNTGPAMDSSKIQIDLRGAVGLAKMGGSQSNLLLDDADGFYADSPSPTSQEKKSIAKVTAEKKFEDVVGSTDEPTKNYISAQTSPPEIYKSPTGEVYLFFPNPLYSADKTGDCQLFKASGSMAELTSSNAVPSGISCIVGLKDKYFQPQYWGVQGAEPTLQFDGQGRIYARVYSKTSGASGPELVRIDPSNGSSKVMVNSNIYVTKFFATPRGGLYYVGQPQGGTAASYFRYVEPTGGVQQIAEGQFGPVLFLPLKNDTNDRVLYAGPKPSNGSTGPTPIGMNNDLLKFDPTAGDPNDENRLLSQVSEVVTKGKMNGYTWTSTQGNWDKWKESCKTVNVGTGIQTLGYQGVIIPEDNGDFLFINSTGSAWQNFGYANPGKIVCEYSSGGAGGTTVKSDDETICSANTGTQSFTASCAAATADTSTQEAIWQAMNMATTRGSENSTPIVRLSASGVLTPVPFPSDVQVKKIWKIGTELFYLQTKNSNYSLKKWIDGNSTNDKTIKFKFEIFSLAKSSEGELVFSGLDFSNNEFGVGYIKLDTLAAEMKEDVKVKVSDIIPID
jgi:hypothetical protein